MDVPETEPLREAEWEKKQYGRWQVSSGHRVLLNRPRVLNILPNAAAIPSGVSNVVGLCRVSFDQTRASAGRSIANAYAAYV